MSLLTKMNSPGSREKRDPWNALLRWEPFLDLERSFERMERLLGRKPGNGMGEAMAIAEWSPLVDIIEDDKEFLVKAELPEVKKDDLKVTVKEGVISIAGERKSEKEEKGKKFHRIERVYGSFERSFTLPPEVDASKITSEFKDGVLMMHLPKNPVTKPKATEVKVQ